MRRSVSRQPQDSRRTRRRTNSGVSVTEAQFQGLQLVNDYHTTTTLPSVAVQVLEEAAAPSTSQAQASSADYLTPAFDTSPYSPSLNYYTSGPAPTVQSTQESPKDMSTYRYAYPPAVPQYDATNPYGSTYQSIPGYDYPRAPAPQVHRSDSSTASMYRRNLSVRSTEEGGDERPGRSHSSSRRSRERSIDPYQAVQTSGPDLSLSGHYASASGIAPAPMIVPSQRTAYPTNYSGTTSASAGPQIYASEYASTHSSYGGGNIPSTYDVSAVDPSSLYPASRARSTSGASADLGRSGSYYRAGSSRSSVSPGEDESGVRVIHSRPKPQCWDHGCNGRQFSTFSNLLRHQRERAGTAAKPTCPHCGAEFTRTTARNGHMQHEKCRSRRGSND